MTTRTRSMALDSIPSLEAADLQTPEKIGHVKVAICGILVEHGPITDDELIDHYTTRCGTHPAVPKVTPQSVRTRRAELVRDGIVRESPAMGWSKLGNRAATWEINR